MYEARPPRCLDALLRRFQRRGHSGQCIKPVTRPYTNGSTELFNPSFPGTCPYITSVGATQVLNGSTVRSPESASERVIFSNVFPIPSYQKTAIDAYYPQHAPSYGVDRSNDSQTVRLYLDVNADGVNYIVAVNGQSSLAFGTSASCPTFASLVNMINARRLNAKKSGFLNPTRTRIRWS